MRELKRDVNVTLSLVRAGLWEKEIRPLPYGTIDFGLVCRIAEEQAVIGLVTAGLNQVKDKSISQDVILKFIGKVLQIEQQNRILDEQATKIIKLLRNNKIFALLVKGQGIARCYEKPQWRVSGDIDLLLNADNYEKAKNVLFPFSELIGEEDKSIMHQPLIINGITVELHGKMQFTLSRRVQEVVDNIINDSLFGESVRSIRLNETNIYLPDSNNDVIIVFIHFLHHFFIEGVGLRQICDWCRLLYTFRNEIKGFYLGAKIREMGLMSEWQVFATLAVNYLDMPEECMPFYIESVFNKWRARRVLNRIIKSGNFGHNNDNGYRSKYPLAIANVITFLRRIREFGCISFIFPVDAPKFFLKYMMFSYLN